MHFAYVFFAVVHTINTCFAYVLFAVIHTINTYFAYVFIWWLIRFLGAVDAAVAHALASSAAACWTFFHKVRAIRTTNAACVAIMREQLFLVRLWVLQRRWRHNIDGWRLWVLQWHIDGRRSEQSREPRSSRRGRVS